MIQIGPCARSDWSKTHVLSVHKTQKKRVLLFFATLSLYHEANAEAQAVYYTVIKHSRHLRTLVKYRKHSPPQPAHFDLSQKRKYYFNHHECQRVFFLVLKLSVAKTNRENVCEEKVSELVSLSHRDFADYRIGMHASSLRALLSNMTFL